MPDLHIEAENEPDGEGNGWWQCKTEDAAAFSVYRAYDPPDEEGACELIDMFPTLEDARRAYPDAAFIELP